MEKKRRRPLKAILYWRDTGDKVCLDGPLTGTGYSGENVEKMKNVEQKKKTVEINLFSCESDEKR